MKRTVINIDEFLNGAEGQPAIEWETFLADEGLELLAAYRAIEDSKVRLALLQLVKLVAKDSSGTG